MKIGLLFFVVVVFFFSCKTDVSENVINENLQPEKIEHEPTEEQVYVCVSRYSRDKSE